MLTRAEEFLFLRNLYYLKTPTENTRTSKKDKGANS